MRNEMNYWLFKSEPSVFSWEDLKKAKAQTTFWDGVRNYQVRNWLRDEIKIGDLVLFYHSNAEPCGVAGVCEVVKEGYPDHTQFDSENKHYDPKAIPSKPTWFMVDVKRKVDFKKFVALEELKNNPELQYLKILQRGNRLSITPVEQEEFAEICKMGGVKL